MGGGGSDLGGAGEPVAALPDGAVEDELLHLDVPHGVRQLLLRRLRTQQQTKIDALASDEGWEWGKVGGEEEGRDHGGRFFGFGDGGVETVVY